MAWPFCCGFVRRFVTNEGELVLSSMEIRFQVIYSKSLRDGFSIPFDPYYYSEGCCNLILVNYDFHSITLELE